jgi:hypothetical protein
MKMKDGVSGITFDETTYIVTVESEIADKGEKVTITIEGSV